MTDLTRLLAHEMAARLRAGETSSRELAEAHLDAAERDNHALNAWLTIDRDGALAGADAADARLAAARAEGPAAVDALHPLLGIPIALKDLVSVEGGQCTAGSRILEGYIAPYDAHITERLRDAGAVILGKTNMDEFAMGSSNEHSAYGPVANPWDLETRARRQQRRLGGRRSPRSTRRSSIGTDTGGSIRQPAALTGIVGLKPTYGRVSRYGIVAFASSLDQIGPFARDVRDAAALLHAIAGRDERDSTSAPVPVPDALLRLPASDDEAAGALRGKRLGPAARVLRRGHGPGRRARGSARPSPRSRAPARASRRSRCPHTDYGLATYYIVAPAEASANLARYDGIRYGPRLGDGDVLGNYLATRGQRLRPGGQAPDHARDVRAVGRLLRRLLPEGAEGPDADQARLRRPVGAGLRRARRPDLAVGRVPLRREDGRPGRDVPLGRLHAAGEHGRAARDLDPVRPVGGPAGRAAADRRGLVRG